MAEQILSEDNCQNRTVHMHEDTPVLLRSLGIGNPIDMEEMFKKSNRETVGFEVAFTAFIATVVLTVPPTQTLLDPVSGLIAVLLLAVTITRRIALDNPFIDQNRFLRRTTQYILYLTFAGLLYVAVSLAELISSLLPVNVYIIAGVLICVISYLAAILYAIVFRDIFLWAAIGLFNRQVNEPTTSRIHNGTLEMARLMLKWSGQEYNRDDPLVSRIYDRDLGSAADSSLRWTVLNIAAVILFVIMVVAVAIAAMSYVLPQQAIPLFVVALTTILGILPVSGMVQFIYARYGSTSFDQVTGMMSLEKTIPIAFVLLLIHAGPMQFIP